MSDDTTIPDTSHDLALKYYGCTITKHVQFQLAEDIAQALRAAERRGREQGIREAAKRLDEAGYLLEIIPGETKQDFATRVLAHAAQDVLALLEPKEAERGSKD